MKKNSFVIFFLMLFACNANPKPDVLKEKLKSTMTSFLYKGVDSSRVKFHVQDVIYYDDKRRNTYDCQFTVLMSEQGRKDTTGTMFAYISKDFQKVQRTDLLQK